MGKTATALIGILCILVFAGPGVFASPVPDTGQTGSYTETFGEDSDYIINPPCYTKLDAVGNDLSNTAASWVMVRDNVTGLVWELKTDDGSIHDKDDIYPWQNDQNTFFNQENASNFRRHFD